MTPTPLRVLQVEDSETDAALVLRELKRGGFAVESLRVDTGPSLLAAIEEQPWDVILSDFSMPDFNGMAAFDLLMEKGLDIPFIFVSGRIGEDRAAEAMRRGAKDYILKDNLNRLVPAVVRELKEAEERRKRQAMADALRESDEKLRANERLLQTVFDTLPIRLVVKDAESRYVKVNRTWCERFGLTPEQAIGKTTLEVPGRPEADKQHKHDQDRQTLASGKALVFEGSEISAGGEARHYQSNWAPLRDESGKVTGLVGATVDLTELKRAEGELRESEEKYRNLVEGSIQGILIVQRGKIVYCNQSLARIFGYAAPAELAGTDALEIVHPEDRHEALKLGSAEMHAGIPKIRRYYRGVRKDGSLLWYEPFVAFTRWQGRRAVQWTMIDVTERKQAEEKLRASQLLLETVFDTIPVGLVVKDSEGRYLKANRAWCDWFGVQPDAIAGKYAIDIPGRPEAEKRKTLEADSETLAAGGKRVVNEGTITLHDGRELQFQSIRAPLRDDNGRVVGLVGVTVDLTELKRSEQALRQNNEELESANEQLRAAHLSLEAEMAERTLAEQRFRQLVELAPQAMVAVNAEGRIVLVNAQVLASFGYRQEELIGQPVEMLIPARNRAGHPAHLSGFFRAPSFRAMGTGLELHGLRKDGSEFPVDISLGPIETAEGPQVIASIVDLTAIRRAEAEVRASQHLLQTVFDTIPHILIVKDTQSRYLMVNKAWSETYGIPQNEALHKHTLDVTQRPAQEVRGFFDEDRKVLAGGGASVNEERAITVKGGEKRYYHSIKTALKDDGGTVIGLVAIMLDLTAEKKAQHNADTAHARLVDAIESLPAAFMMYDPQEKLLLWNSRTREFFPKVSARLREGMSFEEVIRTVAETSIGAEKASGDAWVTQQLDRFRNHPGRQEQKLEEGRWALVIDHRTSDGGTISLVFDVTEIKRQEETLRQSQKLEAIGSLAGGISHDFNNLLTVINSHAEFILEAAGGPGQLQDDAQMILDAGARAAALTRQLLAFSRKQVLHMRILDINAIVGNLEKMLHRLIGEDIELRSSLSPAVEKIHADPTQIEQIVMNLVVNARDAMPKGGKLLIETANQSLDASYAATHPDIKPGDYVMLAVTDTGHGMDQATQARVFEPFFTTKPLGKGTGMGLATVYGIVKQMNGSVFVYSEPGKGTTFKIYFPVSAEHAAAAAAPEAPRQRKKATETVLLVEDEDQVRKSAVRILEGEGYSVLQASGAEEALKIIASRGAQIDLLLSDVVMPGLSGRELWDRMRQTTPIRVLFMSGYTDDSIVRHGILEGSVPFLNKPFTKLSLLNKVREVLNNPIPNGSTAR